MKYVPHKLVVLFFFVIKMMLDVFKIVILLQKILKLAKNRIIL